MKAILVINVPKEYELDQLAVNYLLYSVDGKVLDGDMGIELKPMPKKIDKVDFFKSIGVDYDFGWSKEIDGYNHCLDETLGEEE